MKAPASGHCIAIIADVVGSRRFRGRKREQLQQRLRQALGEINTRYASTILSEFVITTGDEFQGLLPSGTSIPDLIADLENYLPTVEFRTGIGHGRLETELRREAVGMDGSVWHNARAAIDRAKSDGRLGGIFHGFGKVDDVILDGFARLVWSIRSRWTDRQREIVRLLADEPKFSAVADRLGITRQAVGQLARAASWQAFSEGVTAWRMVLSRFDYSDAWR